jgi:microcystin degradation protein MlrC
MSAAATRRIAIAGISHESSTFSLHRTTLDDFTLLRGDALIDALNFRETVGEVVDTVDWVPIVRATATPGGPIDPAAWDAIENEIVDGLAAGGPFDGVYLFLHGAVNVLGRFAAEERLAARVRETVGPDVVISASMDTHGNFSPELAALVDLACAHRHAPHIDIPETHARAVRSLLAVLDRGERPFRAHVRIPSLLPGERTSTVVEPGLSVFGELLPSIERWGVLDANLWVGFAWADEARNSAAAFVTGYDEASVLACAEHLARLYWEARERFVIVSDHSGSWQEALDFAFDAPPAPLYISDSGDNVSAGATGDITVALAATLADPRAAESGTSVLFTGLVDPASVAAAVAAGEGGTVERAIGAQWDDRYAPAVSRSWTVETVLFGLAASGDEETVTGALVRSATVSVVLQSQRAYFIRPDDAAFQSVRLRGLAWVDPSGYDVVVVKNGYLFPGQVADAGSHFMAMTPGGTDLDFDRLRFENVSRPMFPFDRDFEPDLAPTLLKGLPS